MGNYLKFPSKGIYVEKLKNALLYVLKISQSKNKVAR